MKSEERHKLHQNALAEWIGRTMTTIKPYQNAVLGGVIVVILAVIFAIWWTSESASQANRAWTQFFAAFNAGNAAALQKVAEDNPRSSAAPPADLVAADIQLAQGCNMLFISKAAANQELGKAVQLYQKVLQETQSPALRAQAMFGLARTCEARNQLAEAVSLYTEVTKTWPDTAFAKMSSSRLEDLKRISTREIYDRFAQYDPKPAFSQQPGATPGMDKVPEESPLALPESITERGVEEKKEAPADNKTEETKPEDKTEKPVDSGQSTGGEKPVDAQPGPGTAKPAT